MKRIKYTHHALAQKHQDIYSIVLNPNTLRTLIANTTVFYTKDYEEFSRNEKALFELGIVFALSSGYPGSVEAYMTQMTTSPSPIIEGGITSNNFKTYHGLRRYVEKFPERKSVVEEILKS